MAPSGRENPGREAAEAIALEDRGHGLEDRVRVVCRGGSAVGPQGVPWAAAAKPHSLGFFLA